MTVAMMKTYRENRAKFPGNDLSKYDGQWVAFSTDGNRIIASAGTIRELSKRIGAAGVDLQDVVLEKLESANDEIELGGAELL